MAGPLGLMKKEVYGVLLGQCDSRFFLRRHDGDEELLVSDFPRAASPAELSWATAKLAGLDYSCAVDEQAALLSISPLPLCLFRLLGDVPPAMPLCPTDERLWPAYSLGCLMALHPAKLFEQPLAPLYAMLKAMDNCPEAALRLIEPLTCYCAGLLRCHAPLPTAIAPMLKDLAQSIL